jgi:hypothetical protein
MRESPCGLCDDCLLGSQDFQEAMARTKWHLDRLREHWWVHCFPGEEGFSLTEFRRGLEWFLSHPDCPGCQGGKGLDHCPIRACAHLRRHHHCHECPDLEGCEKFTFILKEFPEQKARLRRRQLKNKARDFHSRKP